MPLSLARKWQALRGATLAIGSSTGWRQRPQPIFTTFRRSTLHTTRPDEAHVRSSVLCNGAIIIPNAVSITQPTDLINLIQPLNHDRITARSFCVFFVTPSFAHWLQNDVFLEKSLLRLYSNLWDGPFEAGLPLHALCAVVDKVPISKALLTEKGFEHQARQRTIEPPVGETGFEGMAYITLPQSASIPSTIPSSADLGAIDFITNERTADRGGSSCVVRLPLANTIFQTGTPSTMAFSTWMSRRKHGVELVSKSNISHHGIQIAGHEGDSERFVSALSIPLLPVTEPRRVSGCMGNIVRQVVNPEGKIMTASSELEAVVPKFFESRGQAPHATTAWALVIPRTMKEKILDKTRQILARPPRMTRGIDYQQDDAWEQLWRSDPPLWNDLVSTALSEGARLHRVLSGGGGWGKKAGLISLNPAPIDPDENHSNEGASSSRFNDPGDFTSALRSIVQDGDSIQFFLCPSSNHNLGTDQMRDTEKLTGLSKMSSWGWEFGTVPSTADLMPSVPSEYANVTSIKGLVFENTFGALTERGLTLTRHFEMKEEQSPVSKSITAVDVPFSRFCTVGLENLRVSNEAVKHISKNEQKFKVRFVAAKRDDVPDKEKIDLISRTLMNQVRRAGKRIARLTSECKAIVVDLRIRRTPSGPEPIKSPIEPEMKSFPPVSKLAVHSEPHSPLALESLRRSHMETHFKSRAADRKLPRRYKPIKKLSMESKTVGVEASLRPNNLLMQTSATKSSKDPQIRGLGLRENSPKAPIRKLRSSFIVKAPAANDKLKQTAKIVSTLTQEYRAIMYTIRRREFEIGMNYLRSPSQHDEAFYALPRRPPLSKLVSASTHTAKTAERYFQTLRTDFELILGTILIRNDYNFIATRLSGKRTEDVARISNWLHCRARIARIPNTSTIMRRSLSSALHWHLGYMTRDRVARRNALRRRKRTQKLLPSIPRNYTKALRVITPRLTEEVTTMLGTSDAKWATWEKLFREVDMTRAMKRLFRRKKGVRQAFLVNSVANPRSGPRVRPRKVISKMRTKAAYYHSKKTAEDKLVEQMQSWIRAAKEGSKTTDGSDGKEQSGLALLLETTRKQGLWNQGLSTDAVFGRRQMGGTKSMLSERRQDNLMPPGSNMSANQNPFASRVFGQQIDSEKDADSKAPPDDLGRLMETFNPQGTFVESVVKQQEEKRKAFGSEQIHKGFAQLPEASRGGEKVSRRGNRRR